MKKKKRKIIPRIPETEGEQDSQTESTEYKEQIPREHHHGETGENNEQTPEEHAHGYKSPIASTKKKPAKEK